jgi:DNA-binding transcriptional LysR family regulator
MTIMLGSITDFSQFEIMLIYFRFSEIETEQPSMPIGLSQLRVFAAVAKSGSLKDAAEQVGRTVSAVSMTLKQIESDIGAKLFEADRKNRLTAVGRFMQAQVTDLLLHHERCIATIQAYARTAVGRVDIVCVPSVAASLLPIIVPQFRAAHPEVEIDVRDTDSDNVIAAIEAGHAELGIGSLRRRQAAFDYQPLFEDVLGIVCRKDDPLSKRRRIRSWAELDGQTLLDNGISQTIEDPAFQKRTQPAPIVVYNVLSLLALVRAKVGVTVLPRLSITDLAPDLAFLPVEMTAANRSVGLLRRRGEPPSPAADQFVALLKQCLKQHQKTLGIGKIFV